MTDTHCHLYVKAFDGDGPAMMQRAISAGITKFYLPAIDKSCTDRIERLEAHYPAQCFSMAGLHPCSVKEDFEEELAHIKAQLSQRKFAGIGETGLDFYWDKTFVKEQYKALEMQIHLALEYNLPLILHTRSATQETIDVIKTYQGSGLRGIFHCFSGDAAEAAETIGLDFYLGIGGVVTYKNAGLAETVAGIDLRHIVLETDAPYLAPVPVRGKRNESSYLVYIAEKIARVKNTTVEEVISVTDENAQNIFAG